MTRDRRLRWVWWLGVPVLLLGGNLVAIATMSDAQVAWFRSEAGPMEWGQALFFFAAGVVALGLAWRGPNLPVAARMFYLLFGLAALVVTGEELSWGQHLLAFDTPGTLETWNKQDEANLHNLWDDLPSRLMRRFLEIGLPLLCIALPIGLLIGKKGYARGHWTWYILPRLEMMPVLLIAALGRPFKASDDWGWPLRWHDSASEFAEVFWAYAILLWIMVLAYRVIGQRATASARSETADPSGGSMRH